MRAADVVNWAVWRAVGSSLLNRTKTDYIKSRTYFSVCYTSFNCIATLRLNSDARRPVNSNREDGALVSLWFATSPIHYQTVESKPKLAKKLSQCVLEFGAGFETFVETLFAVADRVSDFIVQVWVAHAVAFLERFCVRPGLISFRYSLRAFSKRGECAKASFCASYVAHSRSAASMSGFVKMSLRRLCTKSPYFMCRTFIFCADVIFGFPDHK